MRIHLKIKSQNKKIPFDHQNLLTGTIHKWLGPNQEHGNLSLYSFSRIEGCKVFNDGFRLDDNTSFFISCYDNVLTKTLIDGIQSDPSMFKGLTVNEIILQNDPNLSDRSLFYIASPIFIKRRNESQIEHITYSDSRANACLKETLLNKMNLAAIHDDSLDIKFDTSYRRAGTKKVTYNGVANRASWCPVIINGKPETKQFAWNVGLGNSTGIGFGAIK